MEVSLSKCWRIFAGDQETLWPWEVSLELPNWFGQGQLAP